jgi:hypothetical protein
MLESLEAQMRALALVIDFSYARSGFSKENIRLNHEFDAMERQYNSIASLHKRRASSMLQRSDHHLMTPMLYGTAASLLVHHTDHFPCGSKRRNSIV